jgi:hypothetical protein
LDATQNRPKLEVRRKTWTGLCRYPKVPYVFNGAEWDKGYFDTPFVIPVSSIVEDQDELILSDVIPVPRTKSSVFNRPKMPAQAALSDEQPLHDVGLFVPGLELTINGMAFPHSRGTPYPIWKGARVAYKPGYRSMGVPQILINTAGVPGMSGSPVYRISRGLSLSRDATKAIENFRVGGERGALKALAGIDLS